jgi:hypothetical protein
MVDTTYGTVEMSNGKVGAGNGTVEMTNGSVETGNGTVDTTIENTL